jgi:hypothetical protein
MITGYIGKESQWLDQYRETHYTITQLARKYDVDKATMLGRLPRPDLRCPYGSRTRLWKRESALAHLGEFPI